MNLTITHATIIDATPDAVYRAFATAEGLNAWFTTGADVDARPGGHIKFRWRHWGPQRLSLDDEGPVLEAEPGRRFVFQWSPGPTPTTVTITMTPVGRQTRVDVRESGYVTTDEASLKACLSCATGWGEALTLLKYQLEQPDRYPHPATWQTNPTTAAADA